MSTVQLRWFKQNPGEAVLQYKNIDSWGIEGQWSDVPLVVEEKPLYKELPWPEIQADKLISSVGTMDVSKITVGDPYGFGQASKE